MSTEANLEVLSLCDEYNTKHPAAFGAILKAKFMLEEGIEADAIGDEYIDTTEIVGATCEVIFYSDKLSYELGFDPRHLRQKYADGYSNTITIEAISEEDKAIVNSSLPKREKLLRIVRSALAAK